MLKDIYPQNRNNKTKADVSHWSLTMTIASLDIFPRLPPPPPFHALFIYFIEKKQQTL